METPIWEHTGYEPKLGQSGDLTNVGDLPIRPMGFHPDLGDFRCFADPLLEDFTLSRGLASLSIAFSPIIFPHFQGLANGQMSLLLGICFTSAKQISFGN